jgi:hypothetical protein
LYRDFVITVEFDAYWKALGFGEEGLRNLQNTLIENPKAGNVIPGTGGARKIRNAVLGGGKRGGTRVIYLDVEKHMTVYLLLVYPKSAKDNLTSQDKKAIRILISQLKEGTHR